MLGGILWGLTWIWLSFCNLITLLLSHKNFQFPINFHFFIGTLFKFDNDSDIWLTSWQFLQCSSLKWIMTVSEAIKVSCKHYHLIKRYTPYDYLLKAFRDLREFSVYFFGFSQKVMESSGGMVCSNILHRFDS